MIYGHQIEKQRDSMTRLLVVPFNSSPRWPSGYIQVLRDQGVEESEISHYLQWIRRFFAGHRGKRRREFGRKEIESYLLRIVKEPCMASRRVEQVRHALSGLQHPHRTGIAGPLGREDHDDLHTCAQ